MVNWNWGLRWGIWRAEGGGGALSSFISSFSSFGPSELPITWEWNAIYEFPGRRNQLQRINMSSKTSNSNKMTKFFISDGAPHILMFFFGGGAWRQCRVDFAIASPRQMEEMVGTELLGLFRRQSLESLLLVRGEYRITPMSWIVLPLWRDRILSAVWCNIQGKNAFGHVEGRFSYDFKKKRGSNASSFHEFGVLFLKTRQLWVRLNLGMFFPNITLDQFIFAKMQLSIMAGQPTPNVHPPRNIEGLMIRAD